MNSAVFTSEYLDSLCAQAVGSTRRRQHRNVHVSYSEPCQRLFNAIAPDSYIRPHRHAIAPRAEMMIAVRGSMALVEFSDDGSFAGVAIFSAGGGGAGRDAVGVEVAPWSWHTVIALESTAVLLEVKAGPFDPISPKEFAVWAPEEGGFDAPAYLSDLRRRVALAMEYR